MFDFMDKEEKQEEKGDYPKNDDSLKSDDDSLEQLAMRLDKAADNILAEREEYKREINQLHRKIEELEEQISGNEVVKKLEDEIEKSKKLHKGLEKRVTALIEKLQDLLEEENI